VKQPSLVSFFHWTEHDGGLTSTLQSRSRTSPRSGSVQQVGESDS